MKAFSQLCEAIACDASENRQSTYLKVLLEQSNARNAAYALALVTGSFKVRPAVTPALIKQLVDLTLDAALFDLSVDFTGDKTEAVALMWPHAKSEACAPDLADLVEDWQSMAKADRLSYLQKAMDTMPATLRPLALKVLRGARFQLLSAPLVWKTLAEVFNQPQELIAQVWQERGMPPEDLMNWLMEGGSCPVKARVIAVGSDASWQVLTPDEILSHKEKRIWYRPVPVGLYCRLLKGAFSDAGHCTDEFQDLDGSRLLVMDQPEFTAHLSEGAYHGVLKARRGSAACSGAHIRQLLERTKPPEVSWGFVPLWSTRAPEEKALRALGYSQEVLQRSILPSNWHDSGLQAVALHAPCHPDQQKYEQAIWVGRPPYEVTAQVMHAQFSTGLKTPGPVELSFGMPATQQVDSPLVPIGKARLDGDRSAFEAVSLAFSAHTQARFGPLRELRQLPETRLVFRLAFAEVLPAPRRKSGFQLTELRILQFEPDGMPASLDDLRQDVCAP